MSRQSHTGNIQLLHSPRPEEPHGAQDELQGHGAYVADLAADELELTSNVLKANPELREERGSPGGRFQKPLRLARDVHSLALPSRLGLPSTQVCHWTVASWTSDGKPSVNPSASFEGGGVSSYLRPSLQDLAQRFR